MTTTALPGTRPTLSDQGGAEPQINNRGQVVWESGFSQIYLWDGSKVRTLAPAGRNDFPQINDAGHVVWLAGEEAAVYLFTPD